jgi:hypothetical protein
MLEEPAGQGTVERLRLAPYEIGTVKLDIRRK